MQNRNRKKWTQEEKDYVYDNWGDMSIRYIARTLGRSSTSIIRFAEREQLGGAVFNDLFLSTVEASEIIGVDPKTIITWIDTKQLKARKKAIKKRRVYQIDPTDFKDFLRDNQDKWKATNLQEGFFDDNQCEWLINKKERDNNPIAIKSKSLWTIKEQLKLQALVQQGLTNREIAKILNRTQVSVQRKRAKLRELGECC